MCCHSDTLKMSFMFYQQSYDTITKDTFSNLTTVLQYVQLTIPFAESNNTSFSLIISFMVLWSVFGPMVPWSSSSNSIITSNMKCKEKNALENFMFHNSTGAHPAFYSTGGGTGPSWGVKWPAHEVDHSPPSTAQCYEYIHTPICLHGVHRGNVISNQNAQIHPYLYSLRCCKMTYIGQQWRVCKTWQYSGN
jgi:hypothetical protein